MEILATEVVPTSEEVTATADTLTITRITQEVYTRVDLEERMKKLELSPVVQEYLEIKSKLAQLK